MLLGSWKNVGGFRVSLDVEGLGSWVQGKVGVQSLSLSTPHGREPTFPAEVTGPLRGLGGWGESACWRLLTPLRPEAEGLGGKSRFELGGKHWVPSSVFFILCQGSSLGFSEIIHELWLKGPWARGRGKEWTCLFNSPSSCPLISVAQMGVPPATTPTG